MQLLENKSQKIYKNKKQKQPIRNNINQKKMADGTENFQGSDAFQESTYHKTLLDAEQEEAYGVSMDRIVPPSLFSLIFHSLL